MGFWLGCHGTGPDSEAIAADVMAMVGFAVSLGWRYRIFRLAACCHVAWTSNDAKEAPPEPSETATGIVFGDLDLFDRDRLHGRVGAEAQSVGDLELVARVLEREGAAAVAKINGEFAIGRLDRRSGALTLWRDHFGVRTLFHMRAGRRTCFSSLLPPLLRVRDGPGEPAAFGLGAQLLLGSPMLDHTCYDQIRAVEPGCALDVTGHVPPHSTRFWSPRVGSFEPTMPDGERIEALRSLLANAVDARFAGPHGGAVMLSGGLDSATIAAAACARDAGRRVVSVSTVLPAGITSAEPDERVHVEALARHHPNLVPLFEDGVGVDPLGRSDDPMALAGPREDPFGHMMDAMCARVAAHGARGALMGYGGDDGISGHGPAQLIEALLHARLRDARRAWARARGDGLDDMTILRRLVLMPLVPMAVLRWRWRIKGTDWLANKALSRRAFEDLGLGRHLEACGRDSSLRAARSVAADEAFNLALYQQDGGLSSDTYEARSGIRLRFPLLDVAVVEAVLGMPARLKVCEELDRGLIRAVAAPWLPAAIRLRQDKGHANPAFRTQYAACHPRLKDGFSRFARYPLWRYLIDEDKVARGMAALSADGVDEAADVLIMNTVVQPYRLGAFLEAWASRDQTGTTTMSISSME